MLQTKLNKKGPYTASIGTMHLRLQELYETDLEAQEIRATQLQKGWEEVNRI